MTEIIKVKKKPVILTQEQERMLCEDYNNGVKFLDIAEKYNISTGPLRHRIKKFNLFRISKNGRHYKINENFFNDLDNEEKLNYFGFIAADGCLSKKGEKISFILATKDIQYLKNMLVAMESNYPVIETNYKKKNGKVYFDCRLLICSKIMYNDLILHGLSSRKSLTLQPPKIDCDNENYVRWFLRGLWDGDGSLNTKTHVCFICASFPIVDWIVNMVEKYVGIKPTKIENCNNKIAKIRYNRKKECFLLVSWLYKDAKVYLQRKYDIAQQIIANGPDNILRIASPQEKKEICELYLKGEMEVKEIAKKYNVDYRTLFYTLKVNNIKTRGGPTNIQKLTTEQKKNLCTDYANKQGTYKELGKKYDISKATVCRIVKQTQILLS